MSKDQPALYDTVDRAYKIPESTSIIAVLIQCGLGGAKDELLDDGQEEVFSRFEVERGQIEHHAGQEPVRSVPSVTSAFVPDNRLNNDGDR